MRISDWSSDVCSSDLGAIVNISSGSAIVGDTWLTSYSAAKAGVLSLTRNTAVQYGKQGVRCNSICPGFIAHGRAREMMPDTLRSEEHTSELQSLMRISYAVFCLKKKKRPA